MTDTQLVEYIGKNIKETVTQLFEELGIKNKIKRSDSQSIYKKTEQILWNYGLFEKVIKTKQEQIAEIEAYGIPTKSKSILEYHAGSNSIKDLETSEESIAGVIAELENDITWIKGILLKVNKALEVIKKRSNFDIIKRYYFEKESLVEISISYGVSTMTILNWKNKLIEEMALYLFTKEAINNLLEN